MLTTFALPPDRNICELQSVNCNNTSGKLLIGQTQNVSVSSKAKLDAYILFNWEKMHNDPLIKLEDMEIPDVDEYKFFGVIFNRKLTFIPHIDI